MVDEKTNDTPTPNAAPPSAFTQLRSKEFRTVYTNGIKIKLTLTDFTIGFLQQTDLPISVGHPGVHASQQVLSEEVAVTMAIPTLKILALHLSKTVDALERIIGPIRIPENGRPTDAQIEQAVKIFRDNPMKP